MGKRVFAPCPPREITPLTEKAHNAVESEVDPVLKLVGQRIVQKKMKKKKKSNASRGCKAVRVIFEFKDGDPCMIYIKSTPEQMRRKVQ